MSFGKLKRRLQALINRKDVTDELAGDFVTEAIADIERPLRIGPMEALMPLSAWDGVSNAITIPNSFLEVINIFTSDGELTQVDLSAFLNIAKQSTGTPTSFCAVGGKWLLAPTPAADTTVYVHFYAQSLPLETDEDVNIWTKAGFNAVVYQAAALAADFFQMEDQYATRFQARADRYVTAIAEQDLNEKWAGRLAVPLPSDLGDY
jgi:hypothetical protein